MRETKGPATLRRDRMTYRTFDIENSNVAPAADATVASDAVRKLRSRRHSRAMTYRSTGCRIAGFGV